MVDFNLIKKDYPKAFAALLQWLSLDGSEHWNLDENYGIIFSGPYEDSESFQWRDLYDFFEEKGLYPYVILEQSTPNSEGALFFRSGVMIVTPERYPINIDFHPDRGEGEVAAFEKAFKILDGMNGILEDL